MRRLVTWTVLVLLLALTLVASANGPAHQFIVTLDVPEFGGPVKGTLETTTQDGCWKLRRALQTFIRDMTMRVRVTECAEVAP